MANRNEDDTFFNYEFDAENTSHKRIDLKFYFNFNCDDLPDAHVESTYALLHTIVTDGSLTDETRQQLEKIAIGFEYGNQELRDTIKNALKSGRQNAESRPMVDYENGNMQGDSL